MSNPARVPLLLMVFAIGGLSALGYLAYRYTRILEDSTVSIEETNRQVEAFIRVRRGMLDEIERWEEGATDPAALLVARDRSLALHGVDPEAYAEIRGVYRTWRDGRLPAGCPVASALEQRRDELRQVDLGAYEALDS